MMKLNYQQEIINVFVPDYQGEVGPMIPSLSGNQNYTVSSPTNVELYKQVIPTPESEISPVSVLDPAP